MKPLYLFLGTAAIVGLGYVIYTKSKTTSNANDVVEPSQQLDYAKLLKQGVRGQEVAELQRRLGSLSIDGIFGPKTEARLKSAKGVTQITLNQL